MSGISDVVLVVINAECIAVGMSLGIGKINDDVLSAEDVNRSVGFESVL